MRRWHEYKDFLLIKKATYAVGKWAELLSQIFFDHTRPSATYPLTNYNADCYPIRIGRSSRV